MDDERLITEVQTRSILFDTSHPLYKDNIKKDKAWDEVAEVVGVDANTCKSRWRLLRDSFVKYKKKSNVPSGSAGGTQKEWKYATLMSFLQPYLQPRSSRSNLNPAPSPASEAELDTSAQQQPASSPAPSTSRPLSSTPSSEQSVDRPSRSQSPRQRAQQDSGRKRGSQSAQSINFEDRLLDILQEPPSRPSVPEGEKDEMYYFALSLVPILLRLSKEGQTKAKFEALQTLTRIETGERRRTRPQQQQSSWRPIDPPPQRPRSAADCGFQPPPFAPQPLRPFASPPQVRPYTQMLAEDESQWETTTGEDYFANL